MELREKYVLSFTTTHSVLFVSALENFPVICVIMIGSRYLYHFPD